MAGVELIDRISECQSLGHVPKRVGQSNDACSEFTLHAWCFVWHIVVFFLPKELRVSVGHYV